MATSNTPTPPAPADDARAAAHDGAWGYGVEAADGWKHGAYVTKAAADLDAAVLNEKGWTARGGCRPFTVIPLVPLPATDDAVEEAARALLTTLDRHVASLAGQFADVDLAVDALRAALRREKRGDQPKAGHDEGDSPRRGA